ncbi:MAG: O-acetyl-ADP-ribose deacetylase [Planctomycetes bacterium]|nr:O-acetyl-ADP-ribose deacetylase [Planctomycetota bacterium]
MRREINGTVLEVVRGDITRQRVDGIGNAANAALAGGGGVDGAIHRAGGPTILAECRQIGGCPTGGAVMTGAGNLPAKRVLHMVGPRWRGGKAGEADLLASCYREALGLAGAAGLETVAFPSVSTGIYGYPVEQAARIAIRTIRDVLAGGGPPRLVRMVLFDDRTLAAYEEALAELVPEAEDASGRTER